VRVWTDGSATDARTPAARAGAGVYWGMGASRNSGERISGEQTSDRAELAAVTIALSRADPDRNLHIYTDSTYAAGMLGRWAAKHAATGWRGCANADLLETAVSMLAARACPTKLTWVKGHADNAGNVQADLLAKMGA
ncbi:ribonuclease H-like protein, partial [Auricularia subglabra TFB-10046 SS5]